MTVAVLEIRYVWFNFMKFDLWDHKRQDLCLWVSFFLQEFSGTIKSEANFRCGSINKMNKMTSKFYTVKLAV